MSQLSTIEWTDATWNPVRGCSRVSEGCRNCYAERVAARFSAYASVPASLMGAPNRPFAGFARNGRWTGRVELIPSKLDEPLHWRKPRRIFANSASDLFHERLSDEAIAAVFGVMAACPQHTFQVLTKRPERMRRWFELMEAKPGMVPDAEVSGCILALLRTWSIGTHPIAIKNAAQRVGPGHAPAWPLPNVWLGVSVEDQATADERIPLLLQTPAAVRFVSYEPALGAVVFDVARYGENNFMRGLDWLIVGGESGPGARPFDLAWARSAIAQCREAGVPIFVKQLGAHPRGEPWIKSNGRWVQVADHPAMAGEVVLANRKGGDPSEWPEDLRVREFPGEGPR